MSEILSTLGELLAGAVLGYAIGYTAGRLVFTRVRPGWRGPLLLALLFLLAASALAQEPCPHIEGDAGPALLRPIEGDAGPDVLRPIEGKPETAQPASGADGASAAVTPEPAGGVVAPRLFTDDYRIGSWFDDVPLYPAEPVFLGLVEPGEYRGPLRVAWREETWWRRGTGAFVLTGLADLGTTWYAMERGLPERGLAGVFGEHDTATVLAIGAGLKAGAYFAFLALRDAGHERAAHVFLWLASALQAGAAVNNGFRARDARR